MARVFAPALIGLLAVLPLVACDASPSATAARTHRETSSAPPTLDDLPAASSTPDTVSDSSAALVAPILPDTQTKAVQATLASLGGTSMVGALAAGTGQKPDGEITPNSGTALSDASLSPDRHTVRATCGYGVGTLTVTVIPDMNTKTRYVRHLACSGKGALNTKDIYRGWLTPKQQILADHDGPGTVAFGVVISDH